MPLARYVRCTRYALRGKKDLYHIESQSDISNLHQQIYRAAFAAYRQNRKFPYLMAGREDSLLAIMHIFISPGWG